VRQSTREILSVKSTIIRLGARGAPKAIGTAAATMPAHAILYIRRRGLRLSSRYHFRTRAGF